MDGELDVEQRRTDLLEALAAAEAAARRSTSWLRHPLRHGRVVYDLARGPHEVTCRIFTGRAMRVIVPEIVGTQLLRYGIIEPPVSRLLVERLAPGMVCFDVGAQYGYHSLVAAELVTPGGTVVAFEPGRDAVRLLRSNAEPAGNVIVENVAVGERSGSVELHDFGVRNSSVNTIRTTARLPENERRRLRDVSYAVGVTTIDDYVAATGLAPDVVKIDAEGSELSVLRGMADTLRRAAPIVTLETGDYAGTDAPRTVESIEHLERLGYECLEFSGGSLRPHERRRSYTYDNLFFVKPA
jgi:FkbM family methyltransferase